MNYKTHLMEIVNELKDQTAKFSQVAAEKYGSWLSQIETEEITSLELKGWLSNLAAYEREKDQNFASYLYRLCGQEV